VIMATLDVDLLVALAGLVIWSALYFLSAKHFARRALLQAKERLLTDRFLILTALASIAIYEWRDGDALNIAAAPFLFGWSILALFAGLVLLARLLRPPE
jgi:hypothetical protein